MSKTPHKQTTLVMDYTPGAIAGLRDMTKLRTVVRG